MTKASILPPREVGPDTFLRLSVAAGLFFPDGSMTASGLRRERDRGTLEVWSIAGKEYTTGAAIAQMREACRVRPKVRGSISTDRPATGLSETENELAALAALNAIAEELKRPSRPTSRKNIRRSSATVIPMRSR